MKDTQNNSQARKTKKKLVYRIRRLLDEYLDICLIFIIIILIVIFLAVISSEHALAFMRHLLGTDDKGGTLTFIGLGIGGLVLWHRTVSVGKQAEAMSDAARNQVKKNELTEAGHTQERMKTSIEHLGNDKTSVRIGAAYELYHLAKNKEYRETVCDILCGHIRQKTREENYREQQKNEPSEEIETFLELLKAFLELPRGEEKIPSRKRQVNLSSSFLRGADLSGAYLQGAKLIKGSVAGGKLIKGSVAGGKLIKGSAGGGGFAVG